MRCVGDGREGTTPMDVDTPEGKPSPCSPSPPFEIRAPLILSADSELGCFNAFRALCFLFCVATHLVAGNSCGGR